MKTTNRFKYILAEIAGSIVYGVVIYFSFTWLAGYSLIYAYFGNLALILFFLAIEEVSLKALDSEAIHKKLREEGGEKTYRSLEKALDSNISFKTMLYMFYVFLLIISQIININPALAGENLSNFINANSYSILLLIALDTLIGQFTKDRERLKKITERLKESLSANQDG
ncbi:MAG: hypothetical protein FWG36_07525 [Oscillospiraceae bacterium]|nr:hypothetical protein [Oscillospiraceae bacterium]